ncbi:unnamed protein product [Sphagnum jensenii]
MPLPGVPREVLDKARFEDPEGWRFLTCGLQFFGDFESRPGAFLGENSDRAEVAGGDGDDLGAGAFGQQPRDAGDDGVLALFVRGVVTHTELSKAFPLLFTRVPKVFGSSAAGFREGAPFAQSAQAQRDSAFVENQRISEYWLSEDLGRVGRIRFR